MKEKLDKNKNFSRESGNFFSRERENNFLLLSLVDSFMSYVVRKSETLKCLNTLMSTVLLSC